MLEVAKPQPLRTPEEPFKTEEAEPVIGHVTAEIGIEGLTGKHPLFLTFSIMCPPQCPPMLLDCTGGLPRLFSLLNH